MFFIVLCTYRPHLGYLRQQLDSLCAQTDPDFRCLVQDDASPPEHSEEIRALCARDPRFLFRRNPTRKGVFHNFEEGLRQVPLGTRHVCFCDQDDIWRPEKLARQRQAFLAPDVILCHSDLELIDESGRTLHPSCFRFEGRNVVDYSLPQLITRNSVTGCTLAFRAELVPSLLPFPYQGPQPRYHHDLWTVLSATMHGRIVAIDEPLVRYRQHAGNVLGAEDSPTGMRAFLGLLADLAGSPRSHLRGLEIEWTARRQWLELLLERAPPSPRPQARLDVVRSWVQDRLGSARLLGFVASHLRERDPLSPYAPRMLFGKLSCDYARARAQLARLGPEEGSSLPRRLLRGVLQVLDPQPPRS